MPTNTHSSSSGYVPLASDSTSATQKAPTYGPSGISGLWHNSTAFWCAVFASIGGLTFGYDQGVIANVLVMREFTTRWPIGPWEKGIMTAVLELGALLGALSSGMLADKYSRRHSIFLASLIFILGSTIQALSNSILHLIIGRAIGGIGVGALSMLSPLYMAEISPPEVRGSLIALEQLAIVLGVVMGFWLGFGTRNISSSMSWRIPLGFQIIPGIILGVGCLFLPASPRLLVLQGKFEEAGKSLSVLRRRDPDDFALKSELLDMRIEALLVERSESSTSGVGPKAGRIVRSISSWSILFSRKYIRRTMLGVMMMFFQQWSAINVLLYYGPTLVESIGLGSPNQDDQAGNPTNLLVSGGIGVVQFLAVVPALVVVDRWGRKPLLRGGAAAMACSHFIIALLIRQFSDDWTQHRAGAWAAVACMYIFTFAYGLSFGPIGWILPSEVFPLEVRSKGVAVSTASNWFNNFLIGLVTPPMIAYSPAITFITFSTTCFFAYIWATHYVPETANRSLEELASVLGDDASQPSEGGESGNSAGDLRRTVERELRSEMGLDPLLGSER